MEDGNEPYLSKRKPQQMMCENDSKYLIVYSRSQVLGLGIVDVIVLKIS